MKLFLYCLVCTTLLLLAKISFACKHPRGFGNGASVCVCKAELGGNTCANDLQLKPPLEYLKKSPGVVSAYVSSKKGARFSHLQLQFKIGQNNLKSQLPTTTTATTAQHNVTTIEINQTITYQRIIAFGGAFTDSAGINIASLPDQLQRQFIKDYFSLEGGIGYSLGRVPIGGTDFSPRPYSYDDHNQGDESLKHFALQPEDFKYKLPLLRMAIKESPYQLKLFGTCWSPPAWMKTNGQLHHGGLLKGAPGGRYYKLFAQYLVRFLEQYRSQNITFWGLTVENEPQMGFYPNYTFNSLGLNATLERDFVKLDLGPALNRSGFGGALQLMIYDDDLVTMDGKTTMESFVETVLSDPEANRYVSGVGYHWYAGPKADKGMLERLAKKFPTKFLLPTEASEMWHGQKVHVRLGDWATFDRYAVDIIEDLNRYAVGYTDWNLALNPIGGPSWASNFLDSPIIINATAGEYYRQPFFYALGHFSKFLVPGSVRVEGKVQVEQNKGNPNKNTQVFPLLTTVFLRPDNGTVLTVLNRNSHSVVVKVHDQKRGTLATEVPANCLQTFVWY